MELYQKTCTACESGTEPLNLQQINELMPQLNEWELQGDRISKQFNFETFKQSIEFVNKIAELAEQQNHHPDIFVSYTIVKIFLWTHAISGLSENDFILAAKIDSL